MLLANRSAKLFSARLSNVTIVRVPAVRLMLPAEVADELVRSGDAVSPFITRGPVTTDIVHLVIEGINTAAAIVTLTAATTEVYRRVARSVVKRAGNGKVTIRGPKGESQVSVSNTHSPQYTAEEVSLKNGVKNAEEQIVAHLEAQTPKHE